MLIPLGILDYPVSAAGATTYDLLETEILTGTQASVTFDVTGLGSTYQHLQIRVLARNTDAGNNDWDNMGIQFNSDTGSNYASHRLSGNGSSVSSGGGGGASRMNIGGYTRTNNFMPNIIDILDPFETTKNTTARGLAGNNQTTDDIIGLFSGFWNNTSSLTSIKFITSSGSFQIGSRFSLWSAESERIMPTPTYTALQTITLGSTASSVTFSSIPATYRDIHLVMTTPSWTGAADMLFRLNGDTGSNYSLVRVQALSGDVSSGTASGTSQYYGVAIYSGAVMATATWLDYSATDKHKTALHRMHQEDDYVWMAASRWASTSAVTSLSLFLNSGSYPVGSTFSLYGIEA